MAVSGESRPETLAVVRLDWEREAAAEEEKEEEEGTAAGVRCLETRYLWRQKARMDTGCRSVAWVWSIGDTEGGAEQPTTCRTSLFK